LGNGMVMAPSIALMASWFHARQVGFASTVAASGNGLGLMVAGPVVPRIIAAGGATGWRLAWYFFAGLTAVVAVLTYVFERDRPYDASREAPTRGSGTPVRWTDFRMVLGSGYAWHLGTVNFLYGVAYIIYFTFFQKRLIADLGLSAESAGTLFLVVGASSLVFGMVWGAISDRIGRGPTMSIILVSQAIAACLFGFRLGGAALVLSAVFFGSGVFVVPGLMGAACGDRFGAKLAFVSLGFVTVFIGVGMAIGPYVGGLLADKYSSLGPSYLVSAAVFALAAAAAYFLRDARQTYVPD
jgi:nitrate/nitrite transporter NarK